MGRRREYVPWACRDRSARSRPAATTSDSTRGKPADEHGMHAFGATAEGGDPTRSLRHHRPWTRTVLNWSDPGSSAMYWSSDIVPRLSPVVLSRSLWSLTRELDAGHLVPRDADVRRPPPRSKWRSGRSDLPAHARLRTRRGSTGPLRSPRPARLRARCRRPCRNAIRRRRAVDGRAGTHW